MTKILRFFFITVSFSYKVRCCSVKKQGQCIGNVKAGTGLNVPVCVSVRVYGQGKKDHEEVNNLHKQINPQLFYR